MGLVQVFSGHEALAAPAAVAQLHLDERAQIADVGVDRAGGIGLGDRVPGHHLDFFACSLVRTGVIRCL